MADRFKFILVGPITIMAAIIGGTLIHDGAQKIIFSCVLILVSTVAFYLFSEKEE